jgi:hypothetical protein
VVLVPKVQTLTISQFNILSMHSIGMLATMIFQFHITVCIQALPHAVIKSCFRVLQPMLCDWITLRFTCQDSDDMGTLHFAMVIFSFMLSLDDNKPKIKLQGLIFCLSFVFILRFMFIVLT